MLHALSHLFFASISCIPLHLSLSYFYLKSTVINMENSNLQKYFDLDSQNSDIFDQFKDLPGITPEVRDMWVLPENNQKTTTPAVSIELFSDPIASAIQTNCPAEIEKRKKHENSENLTIDDNGIRALIKDNCYRSALSLTSRLLSNYGQGLKSGQEIKHSKHSLQLWYTRIYLLIKINELEIARKESEAFGQLNNADMFYEFTEEQAYKSKKGSLPNFAFRLLLSYELPFKLNRSREALQNLVTILANTRKIHKFFRDLNKLTEAEFWKEREIRVLCSIINCATHLKNFDLINQIFDNLLLLPDLKEDFKFELYSAWGRIHLQCGDISTAEKKFNTIPSVNPKHELIALVNKGLLAVAQNDYNEAHNLFQQAHELDKNNVMVRTVEML
ncbi:hypothetical protein ACKWTF_000831 [Chironomus riparius]